MFYLMEYDKVHCSHSRCPVSLPVELPFLLISRSTACSTQGIPTRKTPLKQDRQYSRITEGVDKQHAISSHHSPLDNLSLKAVLYRGPSVLIHSALRIMTIECNQQPNSSQVPAPEMPSQTRRSKAGNPPQLNAYTQPSKHDNNQRTTQHMPKF
jgi:hypothetical protein